jgi:serine/threonine-protein kinase HipA
MRILFCFITGNSDMHLKNFSLIEDAPGSRQYRLSPAYDLLPVNIVSDDDEETALTLRGKKRRLKRPDFEALASSCGIDSKTTDRLIK